jgi:hypothetical protein
MNDISADSPNPIFDLTINIPTLLKYTNITPTTAPHYLPLHHTPHD